MMVFKLLRKKLNSCLGNYSYKQMTVRFLLTTLNWPLILISLSYHENRHATHLFGSDGFENLDFVLNKAAEISTRVFSFFFFFLWSVQVRVSYTASRFIFSADSGIDETRRLAAFFGTRCLNLLYLLGSEFSRHPRGLRIRVWVFETPRGSDFFRVWGLSFRDTPCILDQFNFPVIACIYESTLYVFYVFYCNCNRYRKLVDILKMSHLSFERFS